jgi:hypothetical protein
MTADSFRRLALALPEAVESAHMGHPDFRVGGRIFATLGYPEGNWGMVKLTAEQQTAFVEADPDTFAPVPGGWGKGGAMRVGLSRARAPLLRGALFTAWRNVAPERLGRELVTVAAPSRRAPTKERGGRPRRKR